MLTYVQPSQSFLDLNLEFVWSSLSLFGEEPELILWYKPIFVANPTELGKVMFRLELSWGYDNTLLLIKSNILQTIPSQPNQTKPNSDVFGPINIQECIVTSTKSYLEKNNQGKCP